MTIKIEIELDVWQRNHQMLIAAKENSTELLNEQIEKYGLTSKKNIHIASMYEAEIRELNSLLDYSVENSGV